MKNTLFCFTVPAFHVPGFTDSGFSCSWFYRFLLFMFLVFSFLVQFLVPFTDSPFLVLQIAVVAQRAVALLVLFITQNMREMRIVVIKKLKSECSDAKSRFVREAKMLLCVIYEYYFAQFSFT